MHQSQQVAAKLALVRMALEDFLRVVGVDRDLFAALMIAGAAEEAVYSDFGSSTFHVKRHTTFGGSGFECGLCLQSIDVNVSNGSVHRAIRNLRQQ